MLFLSLCFSNYRTSAKKPRYNFDNDDDWVCGDELDSPVKKRKAPACKNNKGSKLFERKNICA